MKGQLSVKGRVDCLLSAISLVHENRSVSSFSIKLFAVRLGKVMHFR